MSHTIATPGRGPTACADDCGSCEDCTRTDHYVAKPCHCPTCTEAAELDPGSTLTPLRLPRDGGER